MKKRILSISLSAVVIFSSVVLTGMQAQAADQPKQIIGNRTIAAGQTYSFAIKADESLWAWGDNSYGNLGIGTYTQRDAMWGIVEDKNTFSPVKIMDDAAAVSAGFWHSLAIKTDGSLWAWGLNQYGYVGDGTTTMRNTPVKVMDNVISLAAGKDHSLAVKADGSVWAWGSNRYGQIGDGTTTTYESEVKYGAGAVIKENNDRLEPVKILDNAAYVEAGGEHSFAIKMDGSLWAWGANYYGQLGDGTNTTRSLPVKIMDDVVSVTAGEHHSLAVKKDGSVWAWGWNWGGEVGDGTKENRNTPVRIMDNVENVGTGWHCSFAVKTDNSLWAWGNGYDDKLIPVKIMDNISFAAGEHHFLIVRTDGSLWAWGMNDWGSVGDGTTTYREEPVKIMDNVKIPEKTLVLELPPTSTSEIKVIVNGTELSFDQPPIIENGRTLVPLRAIFEALGATVDWNPSTQTVTAVKDDITVTLKIGSDVLVRNGENIKLDVPAKIAGGRTLVPARAVAESFGAEVEWEPEARTVIITD